MVQSQTRTCLFTITAAEGGCTKPHVFSPLPKTDTTTPGESPSYGFQRFVSFSTKFRWDQKCLFIFVFFSMDGGRGEWETSKEAKWRMSWSAMIQQNFIFSLVLTISIKILQIAANFSPSAWFDYWVLWAAQTKKSPCKHQPLYLAWSFKIALKMKFLEHFSCHTKYFFPPSFPSKCIQKNVKWGWEKWAEGN